jgi:hypothetical protein
MIRGTQSEPLMSDRRLFPPPSQCCLLRNLSPLFWRHPRRPSLPTPRAQLGGGALDRIDVFGFLAGCNPHDLDGVADHVGGALLAARASRHLCHMQSVRRRLDLDESRQAPDRPRL